MNAKTRKQMRTFAWTLFEDGQVEWANELFAIIDAAPEIEDSK